LKPGLNGVLKTAQVSRDMFGTCAFSQSNEDGQRRRFVKKLGMGEERSPGAADVSKMAIPGAYIWNILEPDAHTQIYDIYIYIYRSFIIYFCIYVSHVPKVRFFGPI